MVPGVHFAAQRSEPTSLPLDITGETLLQKQKQHRYDAQLAGTPRKSATFLQEHYGRLRVLAFNMFKLVLLQKQFDSQMLYQMGNGII